MGDAFQVRRDWFDSKRGILTNTEKWSPHNPTSKQQQALACALFWLLYGGAAAGGKSDWVLMDAVRFVHYAHYRAIIFRRTYAQLAALGGLIERSKDWWMGKAIWNQGRATWTFPSGAEIGFKHIQHEDDKYNLNSIEIHRAYLEECNQFTESQARYVISRIRKNEGDPIPLAMRMTSNPGGYRWVKEFVKECQEDPAKAVENGKAFIAAKLDDNPHVNQEEYRRSLDQLDPVTRAQLLLGDWDIGVEGNMFKRSSWQVIDELPIMAQKHGEKCRYWDHAATEQKPGKDPDWTAGVLMVRYEDKFYILCDDIQHFQLEPNDADNVVLNTTVNDGRLVRVRMEQEPGSSGKRVAKYFADKLIGYDYKAIRKTGSKVDEARPFAAAVAQKRVFLVKGRHLQDFIEECIGFPLAPHDDLVDSASGAFNELASGTMVGQANTVQRSRTRGSIRRNL